MAGFAGSTADAFALFARFETKLEQHQRQSAARPWSSWPRTGARTACCGIWKPCCWWPTRQNTYIVSGTGDVIEPDDEIAAIGSGGPYAKAAATALMENTKLSARQIVEKAMAIAGKICIYTNDNISLRGARLMVIYLPAQAAEDAPVLDELTPREIVRELDKYVIGQADAKRAVAIALRNRIRRQKLEPEMAEEVMPKNILMIGPTGVGKTELARRLAKLANSPFLKVEASKFTEVGYVGRDVESMIRDLVEIAIDMVREERLNEVGERAERNAEERLLDLLMPPCQPEPTESADRTREKLREKLRAGKLDDRMVEDRREGARPDV